LFEMIQQPAPLEILINDGHFGLTAQGFGFNVAGPTGLTVAVEASTNLADWLPLVTNQLGTGNFEFHDKSSTNYPLRFYRLRSR